MSDLTISLSGVDVASVKTKLKAAFQALAEEADEHEQIKTNVRGLEYQHEDWTRGEPCPECAGEEFQCGQIEHSIYQLSEHGKMTHIERDRHDTPSEFTSVVCYNPSCMVQLYRGPASYLTD